MKSATLKHPIIRIAVCLVIATLLVFAHRAYNRDRVNMIPIKIPGYEHFVYDEDTKIVYAERYTGKYKTNIIYIDYRINGKVCYYDEIGKVIYTLEEE